MKARHASVVAGASGSIYPHWWQHMGNWIDSYTQLLSGEEIDDRDISRASIIKACNLPSHIYKFRPVNGYSLQNLRDSTVWLCSADHYNDPYECSAKLDLYRLSIETSKRRFREIASFARLGDRLDDATLAHAEKADDPVREIALALLRSHEPPLSEDEIEQLINDLFSVAAEVSSGTIRHQNAVLQRGMKICSFSERNDSIVMWGHYADSHKGFCMEYATSDLDDFRRHALFPVIYSDELFDATKYVLRSMAGGTFNNLYGVLAASRKSSDWSYEREWRLILPWGESYADSNFAMPRPSAIYLGSRMPVAHRQQLMEIADAIQVPWHEMELDLGKFRLSPQKQG